MSVFLQAVVSVTGGVLTAAAIHIWRRSIKFFNRAGLVVGTIETFGEQWTAAAKLAGTIQSSATEMNQLQTQFGTDTRDPEWINLESYLHAWRHEEQVEFSAISVTVKTLDRIAKLQATTAERLDELAARLAS